MTWNYDNRSRRPQPSPGLVLALGAGVAAAVALGLVAARNRQPTGAPDSAPGRTAKHRKRFGGYTVVGRTVMIKKPRAELYAFWRDFGNLARFMENVESVTPTGQNRASWKIAAPAGRTVDIETEIVEDRPNELIAWRSVPGSDIDTEGKITFRDAPTGRGTYVEAIVAYKPPAGQLGRIVAKLFQREPRIQGRRELKRFKMLMETGEVATSEHWRKAA